MRCGVQVYLWYHCPVSASYVPAHGTVLFVVVVLVVLVLLLVVVLEVVLVVVVLLVVRYSYLVAFTMSGPGHNRCQ